MEIPNLPSPKILGVYAVLWIVGSISAAQVGAAVGVVGGLAGIWSAWSVRRLAREVKQSLDVQALDIADTTALSEEIESKLRDPLSEG